MGTCGFFPHCALNCQTPSCELPAGGRLQEIAIGCPHMTRRGNTRTSPQDHLTGPELAVVFAQRARKNLETGIRGIWTRSPFPTVPEKRLNTIPARRCGMQPPRIEEISLQRGQAHDVFPFRLRRKAATSPTGKGIGLEITYVAHRRIQQSRETVPPPQGEDTPARLIMSIPLPVKRGQPRPLSSRLPTVGEPQPGTRISVVRHKLQKFPARNIAVCDLEGWQVHLVTRRFIAETKIKRIAGVQSITNFDKASLEVVPAKLGKRMTVLFRKRGRLVRRTQGIGEKCMLDIRQRQFLVLLFVIQAQEDAAGHILIDRAGKGLQHLMVNVRAKIKDLFERRARKRSALLLFRDLLIE